MYTKDFTFKDFKNNSRTMTVHFNLTEVQVIKLMREFKVVYDWQQRNLGTLRELNTPEDTEGLLEFYNAFEEIVLSAYGQPSDDGLYFRKSGRYEFEESALFNACMVQYITVPEETTELVNKIMPEGMEQIVKNADERLLKAAQETSDADLKAEIARLRSQLKTQQEPA